MIRRHLHFACGTAHLTGTLDEGDATSGLLLVSGGNETRAGAFSGQAELAVRIAAAGFPVFRFDRRGVGDSEGENTGFLGSQGDIAAALAAFLTEMPQLTRVVAFGNCDAASALMLSGGAGFQALVLANPWTFDSDDAPPPPAAIRARYAARLREKGAIRRLLTGDVSFAKLLRGLLGALRPAPSPGGLSARMKQGLATFSGPVEILIASRDRTGQAFVAQWNEDDPRLAHCPDASHGFAEPQARDWLFERLCSVLAEK